mmetsp:Transcript_17968/g.28613  ORF Transcript_17968/g.28613 Transcript_17968/m.28613 type:complete len:556 (-) Transcript_17968:18-1685(-)
MGPGHVLILLWTAIYAIAFLFCSILLFIQRQKQPVKFRGALLIFVSSLSGLCLTVSQGSAYFRTAVGFDVNLYCMIDSWITWTCYPLFLLPYFLRAMRGLWIDHEVFKAFITRQRADNSNPSEAIATTTAQSVSMESPQNSPEGCGRWYDPAVFTSIMRGRNGVGMALWGGSELVSNERRTAPMVTERSLLRILFLSVIISAIIKVLVDVGLYVSSNSDSTEYGTQTGGGMCSRQTLDGQMAVLACLHLAEIAILIYMVRSIKSDWMGARFYRKIEFGLFIIVWSCTCLALAIIFVVQRVGGASNVNWEELPFGVLMIRNSLSFFISHAWIVILSFDAGLAERHDLPFSSCQSFTSLDGVLGDLICMQYFREYLISLSQAEVLLCWMEIDLLAESPPYSAPLHARRIWTKYLVPGAPLSVDVSQAARSEAERGLKALEDGSGRAAAGGAAAAGAFEHIQAELFSKMKGSYGPFLASPQGRECHRRLERQEILQKALLLCDMIRPPRHAGMGGMAEYERYSSYSEEPGDMKERLIGRSGDFCDSQTMYSSDGKSVP